MYGLALDKAEREAEAAAAEKKVAEPACDVEDGSVPAETLETGDPLHWLARAAGYADGESWWNHMVEERGAATASSCSRRSRKR